MSTGSNYELNYVRAMYGERAAKYLEENGLILLCVAEALADENSIFKQLGLLKHGKPYSELFGFAKNVEASNILGMPILGSDPKFVTVEAQRIIHDRSSSNVESAYPLTYSDIIDFDSEENREYNRNFLKKLEDELTRKVAEGE